MCEALPSSGCGSGFKGLSGSRGAGSDRVARDYPHRLQPGGTERWRNILAWIQRERRGFSMTERATLTLPLPPTLPLSRAAPHHACPVPTVALAAQRGPHSPGAANLVKQRKIPGEGRCCHSDGTGWPSQRLRVPCARPRQGQRWGQRTAVLSPCL